MFGVPPLGGLSSSGWPPEPGSPNRAMLEPQSIKLGAFESSYRISRQGSWIFLILFTLGTAAVIGWLTLYVDAPLCAPVPLFILAWVIVEFFIKRRTELKIYENGLTYQRLFKKHEVFWDEIEEFGHLLREDYETADLRDKDGNPVPKARSIGGGSDWVWLQTRDGEKFHFRADLERMKTIIDTISLKLWGEPYYGPDADEPYTSRIIRSREIDA